MISLMSIHHAGENYMQVQDPLVNLNTLLLLFFKDIECGMKLTVQDVA